MINTFDIHIVDTVRCTLGYTGIHCMLCTSMLDARIRNHVRGHRDNTLGRTGFGYSRYSDIDPCILGLHSSYLD